MRFSQHVVFYADSDADVIALVTGNDDPGSTLLGGRVLRFRDKPGRYVIQADFESRDAAQVNNSRPQTQEWAARLRDIARSEIKYENLDVIAEF